MKDGRKTNIWHTAYNSVSAKRGKNDGRGGEEGELQGACPYSGFKKEKNCDMKNNKSK